MYVSAFFVVRCLCSTMSLTLVREQCFIRIIYYYYYLGGRSLHCCAWDQPVQPKRHDHFAHLRSHHWRVSAVLLPHLGDGLTVCVHQRPLQLARSCHLEPGRGPRPWLEEGPGYSQVSRQLSGKCMLMLLVVLVVLVVYHWQELLQVIIFVGNKTCLSWQNMCLLRQNMFLSWQKHASHDQFLKYFCPDKHTFVTTKHVFCHDKTFVTTNGRDKHNFVCTKVLSGQVYFCHSKYIFFATNMCLSLQNFCHNKNDTCCSSRQW